MNKTVYIIGVGMDGASTLTAEASAAVRDAEVCIGAGRVLSLFDLGDKPSLVSYDSAEIAAYIKASPCGRCAVLMSGDCGFYSGAKRLLPLLDGLDTRVICGISTPVYLCSRLKTQWEGLYFVSLHGRDGNIARAVASHERTFFLLGGGMTVGTVCRRLTDYGLGGTKISVGENLALENERITAGYAEELCGAEASTLSAVIAENPNWQSPRSCIPDGEFIRGDVPMTKAEVRCVSTAKLDISPAHVCWDVGAGTGSVSVEMALRCGEGRVYAVERNPDAAELVDRNRRKFACDNIEIVTGAAPEALRSLPAPDRVFIGGSGGRLEGIVAAAREKNPASIIVANAVSLETLNRCVSVFGKNSEVTQLAVTRARPVGAHSLMTAENPVFIVRSDPR